MKKEKISKDVLGLHGLANHSALRKMSTKRLRELLGQTYDMRKNSPKTSSPSGSSANDYIDEWISVVEEELRQRGQPIL